MPRSTLEQWRMFKAVADHGGFQQAADAIYKSQSSIHHAVHKMEQVLGVTLFQTEGRKMRLTAAGEQLLRRVNYLLAEAERMENVALNLQSGVESSLQIAVDEAFPRAVLYQALAAVSAEYPLIRIELLETILTGANELLTQGKAEIALSPFTLPHHLSEDLCQVEFVAVAGSTHPLNQPKRLLELEALKNCRQIVLRDSALEQKRISAGWDQSSAGLSVMSPRQSNCCAKTWGLPGYPAMPCSLIWMMAACTCCNCHAAPVAAPPFI